MESWVAKTKNMADKAEGLGTPATRISGTDSRYLSTLDPETETGFKKSLGFHWPVVLSTLRIITRCGTSVICGVIGSRYGRI